MRYRSARLNPDNIPLCLESSKYSQTILPLQINQTNPSSVELIRFDLDTNQNETVYISSRQASKLRKEAEKSLERSDYGAVTLKYPVKKPGLYRLGRVMDETRMEVPHRLSEALVVTCPRAQIRPAGLDRCRGDLSNLAIEVEGTPPLKLKYRKTVNGDDRDVTFQSIQPDEFVSPLLRHRGSGSLLPADSADLSWAAGHRITVPLNETLTSGGTWSYSIDQISDASGNLVTYASPDAEDDGSGAKAFQPRNSFIVHERPIASFEGQGLRQISKAAEGEAVKLPLSFRSAGPSSPAQRTHVVNYLFTPADQLSDEGGHNADSQLQSVTVNANAMPAVSKPGLYTLQYVSTNYCPGEVQEPTSFLLVNPPKPSLSIEAYPINDKCAGRPVGLRVDFAMTGTPPFEVNYEIDGPQKQAHYQRFDGPRGQLDFKPSSPGKYKYRFASMSDEVYKNVGFQNFFVDQEVKPSVSARFAAPEAHRVVCTDDAPEFAIALGGEFPLKLEYELIHGGKRTKHEFSDIKESLIRIGVGPLKKGGEYSVGLVGVTDRQGCRENLSQDAKIIVRHQKPRAAFGFIEGKRAVRTLESKPVELPLRLSGEGPWRVNYRLPFDQSDNQHQDEFHRANDQLFVQTPGTYQLLGVRDNLCPGTVDEAASVFEVAHVERPRLSIPQSPLVEQQEDGKHIRKDVCEGEEDAVDITFSGRPPFDVKYQESVVPDAGQKSIRNQEMNVPVLSAQIKLDTAQSGQYAYTFSEIGDYNYEHDPQRHRTLTLTQRVHPRPLASFAHPGRVYSTCHHADAASVPAQPSETIPIKLTGLSPFTLDLDLETRANAKSKYSKPQPLTIPSIHSNTYDLPVPHHLLQPGTSFLRIRRVRDARGCERTVDPALPPGAPTHAAPSNRVQVSVHDAPSLVPVEPDRVHYCVGERIAYALSGTAPFTVFYDFAGASRKASVPSPTFRRIAESPGNFSITGLADSASGCRTQIGRREGTKVIHAMPSVRVSKGRETRVDIHAGGEAEISFDFGGEPPFEFTYTRSANADGGRGGGGREARGRPGEVLETRTLTSMAKHMRIKASEEGTYEVVAVRDAYCAFARPGSEGLLGLGRESGGGDGLKLEAGEEEGLLQ